MGSLDSGAYDAINVIVGLFLLLWLVSLMSRRIWWRIFRPFRRAYWLTKRFRYRFSRKTYSTYESRPQFEIREDDLVILNDPRITISTKPILRKGEAQCFYLAKDVLKELNLGAWHVFAQVSLGELFNTEAIDRYHSADAYRMFNSKRSDIVITDNRGYPALLVEYQGPGHYVGDWKIRDSIKQIICNRAGVTFLELTHDPYTPDGREKIKEALRTSINAITIQKE